MLRASPWFIFQAALRGWGYLAIPSAPLSSEEVALQGRELILWPGSIAGAPRGAHLSQHTFPKELTLTCETQALLHAAQKTISQSKAPAISLVPELQHNLRESPSVLRARLPSV